MASTDIKVDTKILQARPAAKESNHNHVTLHGRPLVLARLLWVSSVLINLISYVSGIPTAYGIASTLSSSTVGRLTSLGLPPNFPATYLIFLDTATLAIFGFVAFIIFKRRSDEPIAMVASSMLIFTAMLYTVPGYEARAPLFMVAAGAALGQTLQVAFLLMFPDGRFWPRWSWTLLAPLLLWRFLMWYLVYLPRPLGVMRVGETYPDSPPNFIDMSLMLLIYAFGIWAQVQRYRHYASSVQRQQMKWLVWGTTTTLLIVMGYSLALSLIPTVQANWHDAIVMRLISRTVRQLALCILPVSLLYSILRYNLWDVDILINRTLVYVPLTSILAGLFAVTMAITQKVFVSATGQGSEIAAVITTLVITSTITPIKGEIEAFVERRFKEAPDPYKHLNDFDRQVRSVVDILDVEHMLRRLLDESIQAVRCSGGAVFLATDGEPRLVNASSGWEGPAVLEFQMNDGESCVGWLALGPRRSGTPYSEQERNRLQQSVDKVGHAVGLLMTGRRTIHTEPCPPNIAISWPPAPKQKAD